MSNNQDPSFLDGMKLTKEHRDKIVSLTESRDMRILVFSSVQSIFNRTPPKDIEEAAGRYYEAKGLMSLIKEIQ
jgi:signal recognition particle receptor subunit beta